MSAPAAPFRRPTGGLVDRGRTVTVTFDGRPYAAHPGDTLASALLAHGVRRVSTGAYSGRPRGVYGADPVDPAAFVQVESGGGEPMVPATRLEVYDGLVARSLAGKGVLPDRPDPSRYDKTWVHCDVLVVGGGPAGLAAAWAAGVTGARVVLADAGPRLGGGLRGSRAALDGRPALAWADAVATELEALPEVRVLTRTTVTGHHDHDLLVAVERRTDHLGLAAPPHVSRQRLWHVRARRVVLATGAGERPVLCADNDRPGVMLAGAAATYAWRYGVLPGRRAVVFGCHDDALRAAVDLHDAGVALACVADSRPWPSPDLVRALSARGVEVRTEHGVSGTVADAAGAVAAAYVTPLTPDGVPRGDAVRVDCDLLAVSGGWDPAAALATHTGSRLAWSDEAAAFVPPLSAGTTHCVGAVGGVRDLADALAEGMAAGEDAAAACGFSGPAPPLPATDSAPRRSPPAALWMVEPEPGAEDRVVVDLQRDVTVRDLRRALAAGLTSREHVKRYTTLGTGADQGHAFGVPATGVLARLLGRGMDEVGGPSSRPPAEPVSFALLAGRDRGPLLDPARRTPMHAWHEAAGAVFEDVGQWKRPWYYPQRGEDVEAAVLRECRAARERVAVLDASTLGKIDVQGPDAAELLDRVYQGTFSTLRVGRCRYGVMCGADGMVLDDGVTARLGEHHFHMTTTTSNAARVLDWLDEWLQTEWPDLRVHCTSVTDQWAVVALVGPRARDVLAPLVPHLDLAADAFGFLDLRETTLGGPLAGVPARIFRVSFTGELTYEVNVPAWYGPAVWEAVLDAGRPYGITPYGTETMHALRAEKGFVIVGQETDGSVTPLDLGMPYPRKPALGTRSFRRADTARSDRTQLVGLETADGATVLVEGAQLVTDPPGPPPVPMVGHVTSSYRSAALDRPVALALVARGRERTGETLYAVHDGRAVPVVVTDPVFYDPEGAKVDG